MSRLTLFILMAGALFLTGCLPQSNSAPAAATMQTPPPAVTVQTVALQPVTEWAEFTGRVAAVDFVQIKPRVSGYLTRVIFTEGSTVRRGELLCEIDPRPFAAELARAQAEAQRAEAHLAWSRREFTRLSQLLGSKATSPDKVDLQGNAVQEAEAGLAAARAQVQTAQLNLEFTQIKAPIDGRIGRKLVSAGNLVNAPSGGPATIIAEIVALEPIYVTFAVDEKTWLRQQALRKQGITPAVSLALGEDAQFTTSAQIDFSDNQVDPDTGTLRLRALLRDTQQPWLPGMFARVRLQTSAEYPALRVGDQAVLTDQSNRYVFVLDAQDNATYRPVKTGPLFQGQRIIQEGLAPGDRVIVNGMQRVRPGIQVNPQPSPATTASHS